jgi:hypothetical protein
MSLCGSNARSAWQRSERRPRSPEGRVVLSIAARRRCSCLRGFASARDSLCALRRTASPPTYCWSEAGAVRRWDGQRVLGKVSHLHDARPPSRGSMPRGPAAPPARAKACPLGTAQSRADRPCRLTHSQLASTSSARRTLSSCTPLAVQQPAPRPTHQPTNGPPPGTLGAGHHAARGGGVRLEGMEDGVGRGLSEPIPLRKGWSKGGLGTFALLWVRASRVTAGQVRAWVRAAG